MGATRNYFPQSYEGWAKRSRFREGICVRCDKPMVKNGPTQKRCKPCQKLYSRERAKAYREKKKKEAEQDANKLQP